MIFNVYVGQTTIMEGLMPLSPAYLRPGDTISLPDGRPHHTTNGWHGPYATVHAVTLKDVGRFTVRCLNHSSMFFEFDAYATDIYHTIRILGPHPKLTARYNNRYNNRTIQR